MIIKIRQKYFGTDVVIAWNVCEICYHISVARTFNYETMKLMPTTRCANRSESHVQWHRSRKVVVVGEDVDIKTLLHPQKRKRWVQRELYGAG